MLKVLLKTLVTPMPRHRPPKTRMCLAACLRGRIAIGVASAAVILCSQRALSADDHMAKPAEAPAEAKKQFADLLAEYNAGLEVIRKEMQQTMSEDEVNDTLITSGPLERLAHFGPRFLTLAQQNPRTDVAWRSVAFVVYVRGFSNADKEIALDQMLRDHINDDQFFDDLYFHLYRPGVDKARFYRAVLDRPNAPRRVAGMARYALAKWLLSAGSGDEARTAALELFEQVTDSYADLPHPYDYERGTLGDAARRAAFELEHLQVGKVAPEISGADVEGRRFKLSDYRGKVVLLVFCGDWCGPCRSLYPHEAELSTKLRDKPFAVVGVNSDEPKVLRAAIDREKFSFRWFADGSTRGPISSQWNVESWPMIYVLDKSGTIRWKRVGAPAGNADLDDAIESLLVDSPG